MIVNLRRATHDGELCVGDLLAYDPEGGEHAIASFTVKIGAVSAVTKDAFASECPMTRTRLGKITGASDYGNFRGIDAVIFDQGSTRSISKWEKVHGIVVCAPLAEQPRAQ
jgi:hypothetical protein